MRVRWMLSWKNYLLWQVVSHTLLLQVHFQHAAVLNLYYAICMALLAASKSTQVDVAARAQSEIRRSIGCIVRHRWPVSVCPTSTDSALISAYIITGIFIFDKTRNEAYRACCDLPYVICISFQGISFAYTHTLRTAHSQALKCTLQTGNLT